MSTMKTRLAAMAASWNGGTPPQIGVPDNQYTMQLDGLEMKPSENSDKLIVHWKHLVLEGEYTGFTCQDVTAIESDFGKKVFIERVQKLGFEVPKTVDGLEDLVAAMAAAKPCYIGKVKKQKDSDFVNVTIVGLTNNPTTGTTTPIQEKALVSSTPTTKHNFKVGMECIYDDKQGTLFPCVIHEVKPDGAINIKTKHPGVTEDKQEIYGVTDISELSIKPFEVVSTSPATGLKKKLTPPSEPVKEEAGKAELLAYCTAHRIPDVTDKMNVKQIADKINEYDWKKSTMTAEEIVLLEAIGATFEVEAPPLKKKLVPQG